MNAHDVVDQLLEAVNSKARRMRDKILAKLTAVSERPKLSAEYAQLTCGPWGAVPSYVMDDPDNDWWTGEDAQSLLSVLTDMLAPDSHYGSIPKEPSRIHREIDAKMRKEAKRKAALPKRGPYDSIWGEYSDWP